MWHGIEATQSLQHCNYGNIPFNPKLKRCMISSNAHLNVRTIFWRNKGMQTVILKNIFRAVVESTSDKVLSKSGSRLWSGHIRVKGRTRERSFTNKHPEVMERCIWAVFLGWLNKCRVRFPYFKYYLGGKSMLLMCAKITWKLRAPSTSAAVYVVMRMCKMVKSEQKVENSWNPRKLLLFDILKDVQTAITSLQVMVRYLGTCLC